MRLEGKQSRSKTHSTWHHVLWLRGQGLPHAPQALRPVSLSLHVLLGWGRAELSARLLVTDRKTTEAICLQPEEYWFWSWGEQ